jgi:hypothetical protein
MMWLNLHLGIFIVLWRYLYTVMNFRLLAALAHAMTSSESLFQIYLELEAIGDAYTWV